MRSNGWCGSHWKKSYKALRHTGRLGMFGISTATESSLPGPLRLISVGLGLPLFNPVFQLSLDLSRLIEQACAGEEVIIPRNGHPAVRLVPVGHARPRVFGSMKGRFTVPAEFFEPLPDHELDAWGR